VWATLFEPVAKKPRGNFYVGFKSLLDHAPLARTYDDRRKLGFSEFEGKTAGGGKVRAALHAHLQLPCVKITAYRKQKDEPVIDLSTIRVNRGISEDLFRKLDVQGLRGLPIREFDVKESAERVDQIKRIAAALSWRTAFRDQKKRPEFEKMVGKKLDWEALDNKDKAFSPQLRALFPELKKKVNPGK
jgi:hypothetical protein